MTICVWSVVALWMNDVVVVVVISTTMLVSGVGPCSSVWFRGSIFGTPKLKEREATAGWIGDLLEEGSD